ncbi:Cleft lip and palate associated transmembrane protein 1 [Dispira parvispora]|uniref:Cleft lip and palate associated transmembrane protein 1 n=1 Tax=Dispira parvispora TaxID=1520584 RepID=A0A9W8E575_9FUNG|nr:Cleft lip and palate associated transmembrane protein 1 [Dispira parvispora]
MPWRTFMYKALNTFVDDLFAFIIKMPTLHRLACLRDDVVFLVYLYQRWIYPMDSNRANEFGQVAQEPGPSFGSPAMDGKSSSPSVLDESPDTKKDQ